MHKWNTERMLQKKQYIFWIKFIAILLFVGSAMFRYSKRVKSKKEPEEKVITNPYRIINNPGDEQNLYAYELHKRKVPQDELTEFCAVIRNQDPAKDDYKAYCKSVIADIVKTSGTDRLIVYIYDSNEAYELYETKFLQRFHNLDTTESDLVAEHLVATYIGERDNYYGTHHQLSFYEDAHNGHSERETYWPVSKQNAESN